jgi:hypothetical protein
MHPAFKATSHNSTNMKNKEKIPRKMRGIFHII